MAGDDGRGRAAFSAWRRLRDPDLREPRRFPCTRFTIHRHRTERYVVEIVCEGDVLEPEIVAPPFDQLVWESLPDDGGIIADEPYEALKARLTR